MRNKGQFDFGLITFAFIVIALLILAPIVLKIVRSTVTPFSNTLGNMTDQGAVQGAQNSRYVLGVFVNFWDGVLIISFVVALILLFVSAFLIDTNPFFIVLYIIVFFLVVVFAPDILTAVTNIYELNAFATETNLIPLMDFVRSNFGIILTVVGVLNMVIIYAKIRYFPSNR